MVAKVLGEVGSIAATTVHQRALLHGSLDISGGEA